VEGKYTLKISMRVSPICTRERNSLISAGELQYLRLNLKVENSYDELHATLEEFSRDNGGLLKSDLQSLTNFTEAMLEKHQLA
jgi:hypothetical protein